MGQCLILRGFIVPSIVVLGILFGCPASTQTQKPEPHARPPDVVQQRVVRDDHVPPAFRQRLSPAQYAKLWADLDREIASTVRNDSIPGLAVGVVVDGALAWSKAYGLRDRDRQLPVTMDTVFSHRIHHQGVHRVRHPSARGTQPAQPR